MVTARITASALSFTGALIRSLCKSSSSHRKTRSSTAVDCFRGDFDKGYKEKDAKALLCET